MIVIEGLNKIVDNTFILKDINLVFDKCETICVIGASGSGKSSLLRSINYLSEPSSGTVRIHDKVLTRRNREKLCFKIGMVFQQFCLFDHFNVLDNLTYAPCNVLGMKKHDAEKKAHKLLEKLGVKDKYKKYPNELSGGQKQRVAICRALMMNPEIMLFDEPTSALDIELISDVINIFNELKSQMTMIVVTHDIKFAQIIADRIIYMDRGLVLADQDKKSFFEKPKSHRARLFLSHVDALLH